MRQIYIVNATQVVVSDAHPEGVYSTITGYPKTFDSLNYENSEELALIVSKADFADRVKQLSLAHNRAMWTVTLTRADGRQIMRESRGAFPEIAPEPAPGDEPTDEPVEE